jgi:tetratricopeptide (TPR) repeat protein
MARLAPDEAVAHFRTALDHGAQASDEAFDEAGRVETMIEMGVAQRRAADPDSSTTLLAAADAAREAGLAEAMALAVVSSTRGFWNSLGEADDARVRLVEDALVQLDDGDGVLRSRLLATLAAELLYHPRRLERFDIADASLAMARRLGENVTTFDVMTHRFLSTSVPERIEDYWTDTAELLDLAARIGDPHREILAMMVRYFVGNLSGHLVDARTLPVAAMTKAAELGQPMLRWLTGAMHAGLRIFEGQVEEAELIATEAFELGHAAGEADAFTWYGGHLTGVRMEQARLAEIIDLIGDFVASTPQLPVWSAAYAFALCELERFGEARIVFEQLAQNSFASIPYDQLWVATLCFAAEACRHVGDGVAASQLYRLLAPWERLSATVTVFSIGSAARSLGVLAARLGDLDRALVHLARAVEDNARDRSPLWTATTHLDLAECLLARSREGDVQLARAHVNEARHEVDGIAAERVGRRLAAVQVAVQLRQP